MLKRKSKFPALILIVLFFAANSVFAQNYSETERKILELQDKRSAKNIEEMDVSGNTSAQIRALVALANTADSNSIQYIVNILQNTNDNDVKTAAYFALGLVNSTASRNLLLSLLAEETNSELSEWIVLSIAKIGDENGLAAILDFCGSKPELWSAAAMAVGQFGLRKIKSERSLSWLSEILKKTSDHVVLNNISFAFFRAGDKTSLAPYKDDLLRLAAFPDENTRMWAYTSLGKMQDPSLAEFLCEFLEYDANWKARVNIANALGNQVIDLNSPWAGKIADALLRSAALDGSAYVSIAALQSLGKLFAKNDTKSPLIMKIKQDIQPIITENLAKPVEPQVKTEAIKTYAKIFRDEIKDELLALFSSTAGYDVKSAIVSSFGFMEHPLVYKELRDSISADVMRYNAIHPNKDGSMIGSPDLAKVYKAFVEALTSLDDNLDSENKNIIRLILSEFSASKNAAITDICLESLQDSIYMQYRDETCQIMMFDYNGFVHPKDKDVMLIYIQGWDAMKYTGAVDLLKKNLKHIDYDIAKASADALKSITGKDYSEGITAQKYKTDFDWAFIEKLSDRKFAAIKTSRGNIIIELFADTAPFTVQNFVKLSESGYYNNTIFHRVVPNFVIQGGDPTGTGYGGPLHSIRSEFSPLTFDAYTVGMASSGKDTEGSQFFITHSPQPHLDSKYTLFGKVIEGFDVVDRIQVSDIIVSVSFSSAK